MSISKTIQSNVVTRIIFDFITSQWILNIFYDYELYKILNYLCRSITLLFSRRSNRRLSMIQFPNGIYSVFAQIFC